MAVGDLGEAPVVTEGGLDSPVHRYRIGNITAVPMEAVVGLDRRDEDVVRFLRELRN